MISRLVLASVLAVMVLSGCTSPPAPVVLTPFPVEPVERYNYNQIYHPIEGHQPSKFPAGFSLDFSAVEPQPDGSIIQRLTETRGAAIKWEGERRKGRTRGQYIVETTFSEIWPGVVYAPLWLFSEGSREGGHEFDFEYVNGRLQYNLHNGRGGFRMRSVKKDLGGHRVRWTIERRPDRVKMSVISLTDGWRDELVIRPGLVAKWAKQKGAPENLEFPPNSVEMFPLTELWRCSTPAWCGAWQPLPPGHTVEMTVHGYSFTH